MVLQNMDHAVHGFKFLTDMMTLLLYDTKCLATVIIWRFISQSEEFT